MAKKQGSKKVALEKEIKLLEEEKNKLQKGQTGKLITGILFLLIFFPIGIIILIFYFTNQSKINKINEEIKNFEREIRLSTTS